MTDWVNELLEPGASAQGSPPQKAQPKTDWVSDMAGEGVPSATPPALTYDPERGASVGQMAVGSMASDNDEAIRYFAQSLYPNEPLGQAVERFGVTPSGDIYHTADDGKRYAVAPDDYSPMSFIKRLAAGVGPSIPAVTGTTVGILSAPLMVTGIGTGAAIGATAGAAYGGDVARQKIGDALMGDASTARINQAPAIYEAGMAGAGQGVGKGLGVLSERFVVPDIRRFDPIKAGRQYRRAEKMGVTLTPAETTGLASLRANQKWLGNTATSQDVMQQFYDQRNEQLYRAWTRFLDDISRNSDVDDVVTLARKTAQDVIDDATAARAAAASPKYRAVVRPENVVDNYEPDKFVKDVISRIRKNPLYADDIPADAPDNSLSVLDAAKKRMDDMLQEAMRAGNKNEARLIKKRLDKLTGEADEAFPEYAEARRAFEEGSGPVDDLINSTVKTLADVDDVKAQKAIAGLLSPKLRSTGNVLKLRMALENKNPDAWQAVKRIYVQQRLHNAMRVSQSGEVINPAGKTVSALSAPGEMANLRAAMTTNEWRRLQSLMRVMKQAASVKPIGSDTEFNRLITQAERGKAQGLLGKAFEFDFTRPLAQANEFLTARRVDENAAKMAKIITSGDPEAVKRLNELKKLTPGGLRWRVAFGQLLSQGLGSAARPEVAQ